MAMSYRTCLFALLGACVVPAPDLGPATDDTDLAVTDTDKETDTPDDTEVSEPTGLQVLVLGDGTTEGPVATLLEGQGHSVTQVAAYETWDGSSPSLDDVDVVLFLQAARWNVELTDAADQALIDFVGTGGGLIRTERAAFAAHADTRMQIDFGLPVAYANDYEASTQWWAEDRDHPLLDDLPALWEDDASFTRVTATQDATVVMVTPTEVPLVSYHETFGGVYLHLNHDLTVTTGTLSPEFGTLLGNAVVFAAGE
jgi:hypothetical protein